MIRQKKKNQKRADVFILLLDTIDLRGKLKYFKNIRISSSPTEIHFIRKQEQIDKHIFEN